MASNGGDLGMVQRRQSRSPEFPRGQTGAVPANNWGTLPLKLARQDGDHNQVLRGTVQHEVLEGTDQIAAFQDGDSILLHIACKRDATARLDDAIPYGLAVTLEVAEGIQIPITNNCAPGSSLKSLSVQLGNTLNGHQKQLLQEAVAEAVGAGKVALETVDFNDPNRPKTCLEVDFPSCRSIRWRSSKATRASPSTRCRSGGRGGVPACSAPC